MDGGAEAEKGGQPSLSLSLPLSLTLSLTPILTLPLPLWQLASGNGYVGRWCTM